MLLIVGEIVLTFFGIVVVAIILGKFVDLL
jgi:hypothetical protein